MSSSSWFTGQTDCVDGAWVRTYDSAGPRRKKEQKERLRKEQQ